MNSTTGKPPRHATATAKRPAGSSPSAGPSTMKPGFALLASVLLLASILLGPGCASLDPAGPYQGDKVLFEADQAIGTAYGLLDAFVAWEHANRAALAGVPEIRKAADRIRAGAPGWIDSAIRLRDAYKLNPSGENREALASALRVLRQALAEAAGYLAQRSQPGAGP